MNDLQEILEESEIHNDNPVLMFCSLFSMNEAGITVYKLNCRRYGDFYQHFLLYKQNFRQCLTTDRTRSKLPNRLYMYLNS